MITLSIPESLSRFLELYPGNRRLIRNASKENIVILILFIFVC